MAKRGRGKRGRKASGSHEETLFPIFRKRAPSVGENGVEKSERPPKRNAAAVDMGRSGEVDYG